MEPPQKANEGSYERPAEGGIGQVGGEQGQHRVMEVKGEQDSTVLGTVQSKRQSQCQRASIDKSKDGRGNRHKDGVGEVTGLKSQRRPVTSWEQNPIDYDASPTPACCQTGGHRYLGLESIEKIGCTCIR